MHTPSVHLIEGPVGAGKSTFAIRMAFTRRATHIALDEWFARLFSPDRPAQNFVPWYIERKDRLVALIWDHSRRLLDSGCDVILELGLIQQAHRVEFCRRVLIEGYGLTVHVLDAPIEVRRERVRRRNRNGGAGFSMVVPDHVFEMASSIWQPPDEIECAEFTIHFVGDNADGG